ncbi:hypothetical protein [Halorhabdus rudnickae]|uniref:hypothetical protein n=1 Tax=Halorhabdus rudnickae TaxID=1775544 RepID=UPI0010826586|nr:hypothetical protein [Halorhabdus rudnickae]
MEYDTSPEPQEELAGYNLTIGEPTTGVAFDGMFIQSQSHMGGSAYLELREHPEALTSVRTIRIQENDTQMHEEYGQKEPMNADRGYSFELETPIYPDTNKYRYRVEALNESDAVIDAVNVTIVDT